MTSITILGGTGYTGANVAREAISRGHDVTSFSRHAPAAPIEGVRYLTGSIQDELAGLVAESDVVTGALAPSGELEDGLRALYAELGSVAAAAGKRIGIVGGFSALRSAPGAERFAYTGEAPPQFAVAARVMAEVVEDLETSADPGLDWFYISPAAGYGSYAPGEKLGRYRSSGNVAIFENNGPSEISGADFAQAIVDEIETPTHSREHFGVAH
jgi:putative NADH-flavin reductase